MVIVTLAKVPSGIRLAGLLRLGIVHVEVMGIILSWCALILARSAPRSGGSVMSSRPLRSLAGRRERVAGAADQPAVLAAVGVVAPAVAVAAEQAERHHLVDDAGELARRLAALHLRLPGGAAHVVGDPLEDADEDHRLALRRAAGASGARSPRGRAARRRRGCRACRSSRRRPRAGSSPRPSPAGSDR